MRPEPKTDQWAEISLLVDTLLPDNATQEISAADVRACFEEIIALARADIRSLEDRVFALENPQHGNSGHGGPHGY